MIVAMKKVSVIVQEKDAAAAVEVMRSLGTLHIENQLAPAGKDISELQEDLSLASRAVAILSEPEFSGKKAGANKPENWKPVAQHILDLRSRYEQLQRYSLDLKKTISDWRDWGDFEPDALKHLAEKNIFIRLYQVPANEIKELPQEIIVKKISVKAGLVNCVLISREKIEIPYKELSLPKTGLSKMQARRSEDIRLSESIKEDIKHNLVFLKSILEAKKSLEKELEFRQALRGMGKIGNFAYLTGFAPFDAVNTLLNAAKKQQWAILVADPSDEDLPPVLLRNPAWVRIIEPVMRFLGISPGYRELDVSGLFIVFFSVFFGMLIGDAGYGLVYLLLTMWFAKNKKLNPEIAHLFYVLNISAMIWGVLSGTFFGQAWIVKLGLRPLVPALNNSNSIQQFCFFLGALHLSIAHGWRALLKFPSLSLLSDLGWILVLWVSFFLAGALILGRPFPKYGLQAAVCGIILVLFFNEPRKNLFKRFAAGFMSVTFGLSFMSAFTDVVSYVRLFAVGLAGVAIADTANAMALGLGSSAPGIIGGVLVRVVGHALNIVLGPIAILVHGVRLNVLEFGLNHANVTWSGVTYKPLQET